MTRALKPLPKNRSEVTQEAFNPYLNNISRIPENTEFTKKRASEISVKDRSFKDFSVSIQDHDEVIKYYFENTIRPTVVQNGERLPVPILYGSPERWKSVQSDGYYRDKSGKLMVPLIMYKRNTLEKNRNLGNKLDGNKVQNYQVFEQRFNKKNQYDRFDLLTNRIPSKEYYMSVIPDYVTITYSCIIFTDYVEQINPIVEAINFASDSYWGDPNRFKFRARIDSFSTTTEVNAEDGRAVRTTFDIILNGYLIPDVINKQIANADIYYSTAQVIFNFETTTQELESITITGTDLVAGSSNSSTIFEGGNVNVTIPSTSTQDLEYLSLNVSKTATSKTSNTATFSASFAEPPTVSTLPATSKSNFVFYVNGVFVPIVYITSFVDNGDGTCQLQLDTNSLGYTLESADEVVAIGKFNA